MKSIASLAATALLVSVAGLAPPSLAEEGPTTVKVALLDMSAAMGMGAANQVMAGSGMMMMRPGMGAGMMMGPGMMSGMMAVRIDHASVKTGATRFDVTNWSKGMLHEMVVVAVDDAAAALPYDYVEAKVIENQVKVLGDTGELQPNASKVLDLTLPAGTYLLICNVPGHYASGMAVPFTVTP